MTSCECADLFGGAVYQPEQFHSNKVTPLKVSHKVWQLSEEVETNKASEKRNYPDDGPYANC